MWGEPIATVEEVLVAQAYSGGKLELLTSWKEIANFMGKGVRTVQRWEATLGLPVIRPANGRSGIVMARTCDLEAWVLKGRERAHLNGDGWQRKDTAARAAFSECVRELHSYQAEVKALCDQMSIARESLQNEIEKLRFLYAEWDSIRGLTLGEADVRAVLKVN